MSRFRNGIALKGPDCEGQPIRHSQKRSGDGLSSGDEEDPFLANETGENDSDRDSFIRENLRSHEIQQQTPTERYTGKCKDIIYIHTNINHF